MAERPIKSLSDLMDGGLEERFNQELTKVWQNVYDPNTNPTAARKVVMEVKIVPNERRDSVQFHVNVSSKLAPACGAYADGHAQSRRRRHDYCYGAHGAGSGAARHGRQ